MATLNELDLTVDEARGVEVTNDGATIMAGNVTVRLDLSVVEWIVAEHRASILEPQTAETLAAAS
jgi:hypothetical protein